MMTLLANAPLGWGERNEVENVENNDANVGRLERRWLALELVTKVLDENIPRIWWKV